MKLLLNLVKASRKYWSYLIISLLAIAGMTAAQLYAPLVVRRLTDMAVNANPRLAEEALRLGIILAAVYLAQAVCTYIRSYFTHYAAWNFVAVSQYILGIHPQYNGLKIDPCIPNDWDGFKLVRVFRGATYNITVKNPNHVSKGVVKMTVDGVTKEGNIVEVFANGVHQIEIELGCV
jgi:hypothetical protein